MNCDLKVHIFVWLLAVGSWWNAISASPSAQRLLPLRPLYLYPLTLFYDSPKSG